MPVQPGDFPHRTVGSGTTQDPKIIWLVEPPRSMERVLGNEEVARELGNSGVTNIWIRSCDHSTTRIPVITRRGHRRLQYVHTDRHITVYCTKNTAADLQGDVFLVVENNGTWRIMEDFERTTPNGIGIDLHPFPTVPRGRASR